MRPVKRLVEVSEEPLLFKWVNFGKHKGQLCRDVPLDYWDWVIDKSEMDEDTKENAKYWRAKRMNG